MATTAAKSPETMVRDSLRRHLERDEALRAAIGAALLFATILAAWVLL